MTHTSNHVLSRHADNGGKAKRSAQQRLANNEHPQLRDYALLHEAGVKPNALTPLSPQLPKEDTPAHGLLIEFWGKGPIAVESIKESLGLSTDDAVRSAIDALRAHNWWVENVSDSSFQLLPLGVPEGLDWMKPLASQLAAAV